MDTNVARGYLAGLIDGEGCIVGLKTYRNGTSREICIGMCDLGPLQTAMEACETLDYHYRLRGPLNNGEGRRDYYVLTISWESTLRRVVEEVPLSEPKATRLRTVVDGYSARYARYSK